MKLMMSSTLPEGALVVKLLLSLEVTFLRVVLVVELTIDVVKSTILKRALVVELLIDVVKSTILKNGSAKLLMTMSTMWNY
ncbi:hypothetical protein Zmor_005777 [Zophobas morio]|uniref:Uncharacterized protein n=1 Tax=Zophobas morio TaxID=2755281 RepID=A0AA38IY85_9CUCU|nr:hypothetical protein Zmor_005777 [Zophobas morio]